MEALWPALRPFIARACDRSRGRFTPAWVAQRLGDRVDCLWAVVSADGQARGAVVTHLGDYPTGLRVLDVLLMAGDDIGRAGGRACYQALQLYKQAQGAHRIEWTGREGIARWLNVDAVPLGRSCEVG